MLQAPGPWPWTQLPGPSVAAAPARCPTVSLHISAAPAPWPRPTLAPTAHLRLNILHTQPHTTYPRPHLQPGPLPRAPHLMSSRPPLSPPRWPPVTSCPVHPVLTPLCLLRSLPLRRAQLCSVPCHAQSCSHPSVPVTSPGHHLLRSSGWSKKGPGLGTLRSSVTWVVPPSFPGFLSQGTHPSPA